MSLLEEITYIYDPASALPPTSGGGKARQLVRIAALGFDVPRWIAVRAEVFDDLARQSDADCARVPVLTPDTTPARRTPSGGVGGGSAGEGPGVRMGTKPEANAESPPSRNSRSPNAGEARRAEIL